MTAATLILTAPAITVDRPEVEAVDHVPHTGKTPVHTAVLRLSPTGLTAILGIAHGGQLLVAVRITEDDLARLVAAGGDMRRELAARNLLIAKRTYRDFQPRVCCAGCGVALGQDCAGPVRTNQRWCPACRAVVKAARRPVYAARWYAKQRAALGKTVDPVRSAKIRAGLAAAKARREQEGASR